MSKLNISLHFITIYYATISVVLNKMIVQWPLILLVILPSVYLYKLNKKPILIFCKLSVRINELTFVTCESAVFLGERNTSQFHVGQPLDPRIF